MNDKLISNYPNANACQAPRDGIFLIGELADAVGLEPKTIRYYETEGLLAPTKHGRFKFYRQQDADHLVVIKKLRRYGFSIEKLRDMLALEGKPFVVGQYANPKTADVIKEQFMKTTAAVIGAQAMLTEFGTCIDLMKML
jgi:DNA-binding transcriptional MerR regulator